MIDFRAIWSTVRGGGLRKGTAILGSGAFVSLIIAYATQIVLARLYSPGEFGIADSFISIVAILSPVAALRYEDAIMLPKSETDAKSVLHLAFTLTTVAIVVLALIVVPFGAPIGRALGSERLGSYLWILPIALAAHRCSELLEVWKVRSRTFGLVSTAHIVRTGVTSLSRIMAGLSKSMATAGGLIGGFVVGFVASAITLSRNSDDPLVSGWDRKQIRKVAARYKRFPMFTMPATLLGALNSRIPFLLILFLFNEDVVGLFGRAFVSVAIPLTLLGTAVSRVFFVEASERVREGEVTSLTLTVYDRLVSLALIPITLLLLAGPEIFTIVFGPEWTEAGQFARVLVPWFALGGIVSPLSRLFDVLERQRLEFATGLLGFLLVAAAFLFTSSANEINTTILWLSIAGCTARLAQLVVLLRIARVTAAAALRSWFVYTVAIAPLAVLAFYSRTSPLLLIAATVAGIGMYLATIVVIDIRRIRS